MFVEATETTARQVMPIIGACKHPSTKSKQSKKATVTIGACILINEDGWCITCKHVTDTMKKLITEGKRYAK